MAPGRWQSRLLSPQEPRRGVAFANDWTSYDSGQERDQMTREPDIDVAIVGAGISGISMAAHMQMLCPQHSFVIVERRKQLGGTWDLFRYPGVRSDSDMHSLGFRFEPWIHDKAIADGEAILGYLHRVVRKRGIDRHIRFGTKVISADWRSAEARPSREARPPRSGLQKRPSAKRPSAANTATSRGVRSARSWGLRALKR